MKSFAGGSLGLSEENFAFKTDTCLLATNHGNATVGLHFLRDLSKSDISALVSRAINHITKVCVTGGLKKGCYSFPLPDIAGPGAWISQGLSERIAGFSNHS